MSWRMIEGPIDKDMQSRKVMPMKDATGDLIGAYCPCCGRTFMKKAPSSPYWGYEYCPVCRQLLDWSPVENK